MIGCKSSLFLNSWLYSIGDKEVGVGLWCGVVRVFIVESDMRV